MLLGALGKYVVGLPREAQAKVLGESKAKSVQAPQANTAALVPWMYIHSPLEHWMVGYQQRFDAWEEGGVRGIVVGPLRFFKHVPTYEMSYQYQYNGAIYPTFAPDPRVYKSFGVAPPQAEPRDPEKEKQFRAMLDNAASRGWEILFFGSGQNGGRRPFAEDPFGAVGFAAGLQDTMNAFPQASGVVLDGPNEHSYELAFHHGGEVFEIQESKKPLYVHLGMDVSRMERGMDHLRDRFHRFTPSMVHYYAPGGTLAGLSLFDFNEDSVYWLRMYQEATFRYMAALRQEVNKLNRKTKLCMIPRTAAFSILTAEDYIKTAPYFDYIFPKLYFWNRGFDGMYGVVARWVEKIAEWNPSLNQEECFAVAKSWFGLKLPGIHCVADMDMVGFPEQFYSEVVYPETQRALAGIGDANKAIAWISSGRHPHAGDPMPSEDLYRILLAAQHAGLKRFIYHPDPYLGVPEWEVISELCGKRWKENPSAYWPADTPKPDTWNGGRKPPRDSH